jgi:hypothetical protein
MHDLKKKVLFKKKLIWEVQRALLVNHEKTTHYLKDHDSSTSYGSCQIYFTITNVYRVFLFCFNLMFIKLLPL